MSGVIRKNENEENMKEVKIMSCDMQLLLGLRAYQPSSIRDQSYLFLCTFARLQTFFS